MSRVVKANFLILLVLRDNNSCFLSEVFHFSPFWGVSFFPFSAVSMFHLPRIFPSFTFLGCFDFSPFSDVFTFHLSQVFHFSPFSGAFVLLHRQSYGFERASFTPRCFYLTLLPAIWHNLLFFQGFPGSRQSFLEVCRIFHWCSKHKPGPSVCLNHTVFIKSSTEHYINLFQILNPLFNSYRYF